MAKANGLFVLDIFVHTVELTNNLTQQTTEHAKNQFAVGFQFLDYPILVVYSKEAPAGGKKPRLLEFASGKSCVFKADADEIQFLIQQVRSWPASASASPSWVGWGASHRSRRGCPPRPSPKFAPSGAACCHHSFPAEHAGRTGVTYSPWIHKCRNSSIVACPCVQVPLYVLLLDSSQAQRPKMLSSGSVALTVKHRSDPSPPDPLYGYQQPAASSASHQLRVVELLNQQHAVVGKAVVQVGLSICDPTLLPHFKASGAAGSPNAAARPLRTTEAAPPALPARPDESQLRRSDPGVSASAGLPPNPAAPRPETAQRPAKQGTAVLAAALPAAPQQRPHTAPGGAAAGAKTLKQPLQGKGPPLAGAELPMTAWTIVISNPHVPVFTNDAGLLPLQYYDILKILLLLTLTIIQFDPAANNVHIAFGCNTTFPFAIRFLGCQKQRWTDPPLD